MTLLSSTLSTVVTQDLIAAPSICTVHAPHNAAPQPNFVPVRPRTSRSTQSSGASPSTSILCSVPLTLMVLVIASLRVELAKRRLVTWRCDESFHRIAEHHRNIAVIVTALTDSPLVGARRQSERLAKCDREMRRIVISSPKRD